MTNLLLLFYQVLGQNFLLALIAFTALTRLIMLPLNMRQQRSMARQQELQPEIQAIQKKFKSDPQRMQEEFAKLGYNPAESLMGCLPLLIQMPIFLGLYRAIRLVMAASPQGLYQLSERAYDFIDLTKLLPVGNRFLWLNMAQPDSLFILPLLVGGSMFIQQKLMAPKKKEGAKSGKDDPTASVQQSMQVTMPLMFGFFALQFPAGLSIYFVISNLIGIGQGYYMRRQREALAAITPNRKKVALDPDAAEAEKQVRLAEKAAAKEKRVQEKLEKVATEDSLGSRKDLFQTTTKQFTTNGKSTKRKKRR